MFGIFVRTLYVVIHVLLAWMLVVVAPTTNFWLVLAVSLATSIITAGWFTKNGLGIFQASPLVKNE